MFFRIWMADQVRMVLRFARIADRDYGNEVA